MNDVQEDGEKNIDENQSRSSFLSSIRISNCQSFLVRFSLETLVIFSFIFVEDQAMKYDNSTLVDVGTNLCVC